MKKFIKGMIIFMLPVFIAGGILHFAVTSSLQKSMQGDLGVWNDLIQGNIHAKTVIYGSSRAWVNVNTYILEDSLKRQVYNLGGDGYDFNLQLCRHNLMIKHNQKPDTIIIALDYFMFTKRNLLPNPSQFLPNINNVTIFQSIESYNEFDFWDRYVPAWRYIGYSNTALYAFRIMLNPAGNKPNRYHGYAGQNQSWTDDLLKAKSRLSQYQQKIDTALVNSFARFLRDAGKKGIVIIFVYPPEYIEGQQYVENRSAIFTLFDSLANRHSIKFFDYSRDSMSFDKTYFYNSQHLNKTGAEEFTRKLATELTTN